MKSLGTLVLAFCVSGFVAGVVQNQLAVTFGAREEFIAVMMLFALTTIVTTVVLGLALAFAKSVAGVDWMALGLLVLIAVALVALIADGAVAGRSLSVSSDDLHVLAEIVVPTALMIGIQWWLVRRRWLRAHP